MEMYEIPAPTNSPAGRTLRMALSSADGTITFTPLLGVGEHDPLAYLLDIDGFRILLDCGWSTDFDPQEIEPLTKCARRPRKLALFPFSNPVSFALFEMFSSCAMLCHPLARPILQ